MDWLSPIRRAPRRAPALRVNSPVYAKYLDDLAQQARIADAAADARNLDIHFGRIKPDDPFAGVGDDPISDMVAATGAPRRWLEEADYNKTIESMMPSGPQEPFADVLRRNDRSRALINSRLDRLTPEEQVGSLGIVGRQADADAAVRRAEKIRRAQDGETAAAMAAAMAAGGGAFALRVAQERDRAADADALRAAAEEAMRRDMIAGLSENPDGGVPMTIDIGEDSPIGDFDPMAEMAVSEPGVLVDEPRTVSDAELNDASASMLEMLFADDPLMEITPDSPEEAVAAAPGPEMPVGMNRDLEDLPGPQMRSVRALMAAGIPESRAMAIIIKGSSMSPDEYRMVTGGRR